MNLNLKIGISASARFLFPAEIFRLADQLNAGVELTVLRWQTLSYWKRLANKFPNVEIIGVHGPFCASYGKNWKNICARNITAYQRILHIGETVLMGTINDNPSIKIAKELGCPLIIHPNGIPDNPEILPTLVYLENPASYEDPRIVNPWEFLVLAQRYSFGTVFDPEHAAIPPAEWDIGKAFRAIHSRYIHISDYRNEGRKEHLIPGEGDINFSPLFQAMKETGGDYTMVIELRPYKDLCQALEKSINFLKENLL